jgi:flagellar hook-associated protein 3 FlgL
MDRVSNNLMNDNMQYYTGQRQVQLDEANSRIASQNRLLNLSDDPAAAAHATRYESYITRLQRFSDNIQSSVNTYQFTESHMQGALDILHRARELAIQGATGSSTDTKGMAGEIDELLDGLVEISNTIDSDGSALFAGERTRNTPFRTVMGTVPGGDHAMVVGVDYLGDIAQRQTEVADGQYIKLNFPGNQVFWAENQMVAAARDSRDFVATQDAKISLDGINIDVRQGDNVHALVAKINASDAAVKAHVDDVNHGLVIETTTPHQLWVKDLQGNVFQTLGIVGDADQPPPHNISNDASKTGGSMFDMLMNLRNQLLAGNQLQVGGAALGGIDVAMNNLLGQLGEVGAKSERMQLAYKRVEKAIPDMQARLSLETDVDMTKAITDMKVIELAHEASLSATARMFRTSLLDFLR